MSVSAARGGEFTAFYDAGITGLVGTLAVRVDDLDDTTVVGPEVAGIEELGTTGNYVVTLAAPTTGGVYAILWSEDGTFDPGTGGMEELIVVGSALSLPPLSGDGGAGEGPCTAWTTPEQVVECCPDLELTDPRLPLVIAVASEVLYTATSGQFPGECGPVTVRPCAAACSCWDALPLDVPRWEPWSARWRCGGRICGCAPMSEVLLDGHPIREIVEVLIDGAVVDPTEYELYLPNRLVRLRDSADPTSRRVWPGCQIMDLPPTEAGTFAVTYTYGAAPPWAGVRAASALACELWKECANRTCALPKGTTRVVRAGITIDKASAFAAMLEEGATGILEIDTFMGNYGRKTVARSTVWSPDLTPYPEQTSPAGGS